MNGGPRMNDLTTATPRTGTAANADHVVDSAAGHARLLDRLLNEAGALPDRLMNLGFHAERRARDVTRETYMRELAFYDRPEFREDKRFLDIPDDAPPLAEVSRRAFGDGEQILFRYPSRYRPRNPDVAERFLAHAANRTGYLFLWRHRDDAGTPPRPLVLCVHGFRMGNPRRAMAMFRVRRLFAMGMDVALFIQPHHWLRADAGWRQNFFVAEDLPLTLENVGQQVHDLHSCFLALRDRGYERIGLIGGSLGGLAVTLHATQSAAPAFVFSVVPAIRVDVHLDPAQARLPFRADEAVRAAAFRALDLVDPSFYAPRLDLAHFGVVYHRGDRINEARATEAWARRWQVQHVTALAGGHWVVFDRKARGAAWYGWLHAHGFCD